MSRRFRHRRLTPTRGEHRHCQMSEAPETSVEAGRVGRPHGLDGSFYLTGARPGLLLVGVSVILAGRRLRVLRYAGMEKRPIVRLEGVDSRTAAQELSALVERVVNVCEGAAHTVPAAFSALAV